MPTSDIRRASSSEALTAPSDPPDGGYGWVCVTAVFFLNGFTWGIVTSFGVFLAYYLDNEVFPGGNSVSYAFIGSLNFTFALLMCPIATRTCEWFNMKYTLAAGVLCQAGGFVAASFAQNIWQLFLSQGVLVGIGVGFIYAPMLPIVSQWFGRRRSLANGLSSAGAGICGMAMSFATHAFIARLGVHWALRLTGIISLVVNAPAAALLRNRDAAILPNRRAFDVALLRRYDVLLLLLWSFTMMFGYITLTYSLSDYAKSIGLDSAKASYQTAFMNLGVGVGRPLAGLLSDRFGRIEVSALLTILTGILCFALWIPATSYGLLTFFSILGGTMLGIFWPAVGPISTEIVGLKDLYSALSLAWLTVVLPCTFSEVIALKLRRPQSGRPYLYAQVFSGVAYLIGSLFLFELARVMRKRRKSEKIGVDISTSSCQVPSSESIE